MAGKYLVFRREQDKERIVIFPEEVSHCEVAVTGDVVAGGFYASARGDDAGFHVYGGTSSMHCVDKPEVQCRSDEDPGLLARLFLGYSDLEWQNLCTYAMIQQKQAEIAAVSPPGEVPDAVFVDDEEVGLRRHTAALCGRCGGSHAPNMPCRDGEMGLERVG